MVHYHCGPIPRHEVPPTTDAQWERALQFYGVDRPRYYHHHSATFDTASVGPEPVSPKTTTAEGAEDEFEEPEVLECEAPPPSRPLIHQESLHNDPLPPPAFHLYDGDGSDNRSADWRQRMNRHFSWSDDVRVLGGTAADGETTPVTSRPRTPQTWAWPPAPRPDAADIAGDDDPDQGDDDEPTPWAAVDLSVPAGHPSFNVPHRTFDRQYQIIDSVGLPRYCKSGNWDKQCIDSERHRIRDHYEHHGWLPAPVASMPTRLRRSHAVRRLGLSDEDDNVERYAVMAKYSELAKLVFNVESVVVSIFRGEEEVVFRSETTNSGEKPMVLPSTEGFLGHVVLHPEEQVTVVADLTKDWRYKRNPSLVGKTHRFLAAAPLRYHRPGGADAVDFGMLCVFDDKPRDEFSTREQGILLRLANMLVFQMATLQSEIMAKRSSGMYEASINFLRRSLVPDHLKPSGQQEKQPHPHLERSPSDIARDKKKLAEKEKKRTAKNHHRTSIHSTHSHRPRLHHRAQSHHVTAHHSPLHGQGGSPSGSGSSTPVISPTPPAAPITKSSPSDTRSAKRKDVVAETAMFNDAATTLRGILQADAVTILDMHDHQLFIRKSGSRHSAPHQRQTKEAIIGDFLQGKEWPSNVEPVVNYVPRSSSRGLHVLGKSETPGFECDFTATTAPQTISKFVKTYLMTRHFWWDREDENDELAKEVMMLMPGKSQTVLATVFMGFDGTLRYATFASWARAPTAFDDTSRLALPFVWIVGATLISALALRRVRTIEQSQISYSNLQAHELRTPLHQILAITQLLRSSMSDLAEAPSVAPIDPNAGSLTTLQQIRDLLPFLDAIDTSGKTLHGIVDNILSFLDLKAKDTRFESSHSPSAGLLTSPSGAPQPLSTMFEEIITEVYNEDRRGRRASGQQVGHIETVFEIIPDRLGELVTEDSAGALRKALSKILSNAYRYIESEGCVQIYVDDVKGFLPPEGCEDLATTRRVAITVVDNGRGMAAEFIREKLGEPWAKEDLYATGSGLSVHLAYRIVDLMGGQMEITSASGHGCTVSIEVPLPGVIMGPDTPSMESALAAEGSVESPGLLSQPPAPTRKIALVGFDKLSAHAKCSYDKLGESLERSYKKLGCAIVPVEEADVVIADGAYEDDPEGAAFLKALKAPELTVFISEDNEQSVARPKAERTANGTVVRRLLKPITLALIKETLKGVQPNSIPVTPLDDAAVARLKPHFDSAALAKPASCAILSKFTSFSWKPKGVCVEEAVASLCLGDYFSSRQRVTRAPSNGSSVAGSTSTDHVPDSPLLGTSASHSSPVTTPSEDAYEHHTDTNLTTPSLGPGSTTHSEVLETPLAPPVLPPPPVKVLVVEDNVINRKILVKILSAKLPLLEIIEAEDGQAAVDKFKEFTSPAIVLLDINMPRMDGYAAATEMRLIEKRRAVVNGKLGALGINDGDSGAATPAIRSKIIAVTALASDDERRRGLVECQMDQWLTKPCPKATLQGVVMEARQELLNLLAA
ncbi:Response regulator mcs4 [Vanrija pseudolonga]|uniref:histidine kinase n=1 Tax=Vanrija pseudolonga TaxID=143232 RepID=A0AAF1BFD9_9TREE|nr:Response regulator mcs4 [Vanrija pseudolonga]